MVTEFPGGPDAAVQQQIVRGGGATVPRVHDGGGGQGFWEGQDNLYVASENGITTFDVSGDPTDADYLKEPITPWVHGGAVLLDGLEISGTHHLVFGRDTAGVTFFNAIKQPSGDWEVTANGKLAASDRGYGVCALNLTPDPWLFVALSADAATKEEGSCRSSEIHGGVWAYRIVDSDSDGLYEATEADLMGNFSPQVCDGNDVDENEDYDGYFLDVHVPGTVDTDTWAVWVTYGPRDNEEGAGIMVLRAVYDDPVGEDPTLTFETDGSGDFVVQKIPAFTPDPEEQLFGDLTGRLTYPPGGTHHARIYAAFACNGIAAFDVGDYDVVTLREAWSGEADGLSALQVRGATGDRMFATFINWDTGGIGEFDYNNINGGPIDPDSTNMLHRATWTANALWPAPSSWDPNDPAFFVADGAGGLLLMQFEAAP
jgi:hypothetical protein